jgi:hypothetical protein
MILFKKDSGHFNIMNVTNLPLASELTGVAE